MIFENEGIFGENPNVKFLFYRGEIPKLLVVFGGYGGEYNYTRFLSDVPCHKLFILDHHGYSNFGCWYLGENNTLDVAETVYSLIEVKRNELGLSKEDLILCGVSMGGFASLYFGIKYEYQYIIASAPQIYLYTYLKNLRTKEILPAMVGTVEGEHLDHLFDTLHPTPNQKLYLFCGYIDYHLRFDLVPFLNGINLDTCKVSLQLYPGEHNIGRLLGPVLNQLTKAILTDCAPTNFLTEKSKRQLFDPEFIVNDSTYVGALFTKNMDNQLLITCYHTNINLLFACEIYGPLGLLIDFPYQRNSQFILPLETYILDQLTFKISLQDQRGNVTSKTFTNISPSASNGLI